MATDPAPLAIDSPGGESYEIDDPKILQLVYDPLRFRLLLLTSAEPRTVTELAEAVGRPRGRLYYHVHKLEEHGLLTVAGQHTVGTRVEHSYRARYSSFRLSPALRGHPLARAHAPLPGVVHDLVDRQLDAYAALAAESPVLLLNRQRRLSPERAAEFRRRAAELMEEFLGDGAPADDEGTWYAGTLLVTPAAAPVPGPPARS